MADTTVLSRATSNSESLRTTVPRSIVKHFGLREGDTLEWRLEIRSSELTIEVSPVKRTQELKTEGPKGIRKRLLARRPARQDSSN
jgi:bifunctional DNA-binding transcriptional regulator/antitoxin component of YhaV-PrlF toxin-antitoxin module